MRRPAGQQDPHGIASPSALLCLGVSVVSRVLRWYPPPFVSKRMFCGHRLHGTEPAAWQQNKWGARERCVWRGRCRWAASRAIATRACTTRTCSCWRCAPAFRSCAARRHPLRPWPRRADPLCAGLPLLQAVALLPQSQLGAAQCEWQLPPSTLRPCYQGCQQWGACQAVQHCQGGWC